MIRKSKRALAFSMAVVLSLSMSACSKGTAASSSGTPNSGEASKSDAADKTPITLSVGIQAANCTLEGVHQECSVMADITKQTGVTLSFVPYDKDKYTILVAGGDLPDIISTFGDTAANKSAMQSGQFLALDDLLANYGQNIVKNIPKALKWSKEIYGGGKTYLLPTNVQIADLSNPETADECTFNARYDVYKAIGSPKISGDDSFLSVLKQMQDYERNRFGTDDIYALSAWTDWGTWPYIIDYPFAYGYMNSNYNQLLSPSGELESQFLDVDGVFWQGIKFFQKAYSMGIFDAEGLTQKYSQYSDKIKKGKVLCAGLNSFSYSLDRAALGENAVLAVLPGSTQYIPAVYNTDSILGYSSSNARAINANCKYPERAMQFLNWCDSVDGARMLTNGNQGVEWDYVNGVPQLIGEYKDAVLNGTGNDYAEKHQNGILGTNKADLGRYLTTGQFKTDDGYPIDLKSTKELKEQSAYPAQKSFAQDFGSDLHYFGEVYDKWIKAGDAKTITSYGIASGLMESPTDKTITTESKATEYFMANISKVVLAKSNDEFEAKKAEMIQAFKDMGLEACDQEIQTLYQKAKTVADPFMSK